MLENKLIKFLSTRQNENYLIFMKNYYSGVSDQRCLEKIIKEIVKSEDINVGLMNCYFEETDEKEKRLIKKLELFLEVDYIFTGGKI